MHRNRTITGRQVVPRAEREKSTKPARNSEAEREK